MSRKSIRKGEIAGLSDAPPHFHGHRERLRDRFRQAGADAVSDYELLELVLFRAIPQRDVKPLAKDLISKFGSFPEVIAAPAARLGIGDAAITELRIVHAAASRMATRPGAKTAGAFVLVERDRLLPYGDGLRREGAVSCSLPRQAQSVDR
jgi:hypothetical protein